MVRLMYRFINLFLALFLLDGTVSFFDDVLHLLSLGSVLSVPRNLVASLAILATIPVYLCLGIDSRIPRLRIIPLAAFIYLSFIWGWLFPEFAGSRSISLLMSTMQILLAIITYSPFHPAYERRIFLKPDTFTGPAWSWKKNAPFWAANILIIPAVIISCLLATANEYATHLTSGFVRVSPRGVFMSERTYLKDDRKIRLIAMVHVGEQTYYDDLFKKEWSSSSIILVEGVSDKKLLLQNRLSYGKAAAMLGLVSQEKMRFAGRPVELKDIGKNRQQKNSSNRFVPDMLRADVDVSVFNPKTIAFLNAAGKYMNDGNSSFREGMAALNAWSEQHMTPQDNMIVMDDIIQLRNKAVIGFLDKVLPSYNTIIIPWGALHMPEVEQAVLKRGFELQDSSEHLSLDFFKLVKSWVIQ